MHIALKEKTQLYRLQDTDLISVHEDRPYALRFRDIPAEEKPREKMLKYGPAILNLPELLAVIFATGTKKEDVLTMSNRLLKEYGERAIIHEVNPKKVAEALNIPILKACQLLASLELGRRFFKTGKDGKPEFLRTSKQVFGYLQDMKFLPKEHLRGLYLDAHYRLIHDEVISVGSLTANIVHPREVFRPALERSAVALILAHNHPSGIAKPSLEDVKITAQLVEAGNILGIHVLDHIIITKSGHVSVPVNYNL